MTSRAMSRSKRYFERHPERRWHIVHPGRARDCRLRRLFGIGVDEYERLLKYQGGVCAICRRSPKNNRLSVDHRHSDGLVRGLICWHCNRALGNFSDSAERLRGAADYLQSPPAVAAFGREVFGKKGRVR